MKKIIIAAIVCFFAQGGYAQQTLKFSVKYLPTQKYATVNKMDFDMTMNMPGQPAAMAMKMDMTFALDLLTDAANAKKEVPFTANYTDFTMNGTMNGQALPFPQTQVKGFSFVGRYLDDTKKLTVDAINGDTSDPAAKATAQEQMSQIFNQYSMPDATLKVGDTFEQDVPISVPVGAGNTQVMTKMKYTLKEINSNEALFDLDQKIDMTMDLPDGAGKMIMTGTGKGTMVYDIAAMFPVSTTVDSKYTFKMDAGGMQMTGDMKGSTVGTVKVTKK